MPPRPRRIFAAVALLFGLFLLFFEIRNFVNDGASGSGFWLLVAVLMVILGALEVFSRTPPPK
jgi:hypothetical protein